MVLRRRASGSRSEVRNLRCYSLTFYTRRLKEVRDFYVDILGGQVVSEREQRYCDLIFGGVPICFRAANEGEGLFESHFHVYLARTDRESLLDRLRSGGVIVRMDGPYASFLDPEGRTIKVTKEIAVIE
jgi:catechol 2,3-dioxygenase-like lactoylglutathione lyase family enzyme